LKPVMHAAWNNISSKQDIHMCFVRLQSSIWHYTLMWCTANFYRSICYLYSLIAGSLCNAFTSCSKVLLSSDRWSLKLGTYLPWMFILFWCMAWEVNNFSWMQFW
jgi:hypothetical protein